MPNPPEMQAKPCGSDVCISVTSTVELARFILQIHEIQIALTGCSLVKFE